jgi:hypothetical protein
MPVNHKKSLPENEDNRPYFPRTGGIKGKTLWMRNELS